MKAPLNGKQILSDNQVLEIINVDRFRPTLKCDLFVPSYIQSLSVATEFIYSYVLERFPKDFFESIHVSGKNIIDDFRRFNKGEYPVRENPAVSIAYTLQYDFNDNNLDWNWLSTNKYLRTSAWQRSFFKCPKRGLYIGMDLEAMLINYNFKFRVNTRPEQLDLYNRIRKVFRLGCTETNDIDCDFHLDRKLMTKVAEAAGFAIDTDGQILDPWNFTRFLNAHSQMPILYKLRLINQHYEWFLRMRNLPVHLDFQNPLDVDDGQQTGMDTTDYTIEFQIAVRFPAPRTFAFYNEGNWKHEIYTEPNEGITIYSMKLFDIPEENYKGWPLYGHSNYMAEKEEVVVKYIDIKELFVAPVDIKVGTSLDDLIQDSLNNFVSPDVFIEIAVYTNDLLVHGSGRVPIVMDWEKRRIILPDGIPDSYFYLAIYVDRKYVNDKIVEITNADYNRVMLSKIKSDKILEKKVQEYYNHDHIIEKEKFPNGNLKKKKKAQFIIKIGE